MLKLLQNISPIISLSHNIISIFFIALSLLIVEGSSTLQDDEVEVQQKK